MNFFDADAGRESETPPGAGAGWPSTGVRRPDWPYRLVYRSTSTLPDQAQAQAAGQGIPAILEVSRRRNAAAEVSGALVYAAGHFAQVIEGPQAAVLECFGRIRRDPRHRDIELLQSRLVPKRYFGDWQMAFVDGSDSGAILAPNLGEKDDAKAAMGSYVVGTLRRLIRA